MHTASGEVKSTKGFNVQATFYLNEIPYFFVGTLNPAAVPFKTSQATLTYSSIADLTATRPFVGQLGPSTITFTIQNRAGADVDVKGTLEKEVTETQFVGTGIWTASVRPVNPEDQLPVPLVEFDGIV